MAQGKMKVKTKVPTTKKSKQGKPKKGPAVMQRRISKFEIFFFFHNFL